MKKITLFLFLLSFITITSIEAQITTFPYTEDFESGDGGWVPDNTSNGTWAIGTPTGAIINSAASGTNAWVTNLSGNYNSGEDSSVTSPVFDFTSLAAPSIEMNIWYDIEFSWDGAVFQSSIDGGTTWNNVGAVGDPNNWYTDDSINGNPGGQQDGWSGTGAAGTNAWVIARHGLTGLAGESNVIFRIAFGSDGSVTDEGFGFDDINIFDVSCPEPTDIAISNVTETEADINWLAGGTETLWNLEWGIAGFTPGAGTLETGLTATTFNLTGLTLGTSYDVYIEADCGGVSISSLVGPIIFNTAVPGGSCSAAFPMTVEADCSTATPVSLDFSIAEDIDAAGENPTCDGFGNFGYWVNFTAPTIGSVIFNFGGAADGIGLEILDACGGTSLGCFNNVFDAGDSSDIISGLTPGNTYVAVIWRDGQTGAADVCIEAGPSCTVPINLTATNITLDGADLGWLENGGATSWNVEVVLAGDAPTGIPTATGVTNPYTVTGLLASTNYDFYVQADCGGGDTSDFNGPFTFTTLCDVFVPDYIENFTIIIPNCWDEADNGDATTGPTDLGNSSWGADEFLNIGAGDGAYRINLWLAAKSDWLLSPQFDLTGGPFQVEFDFGIMQFASSVNAGTLGSDDTVQLLITVDAGASWTPLLTYDATSVVAATGEHPVIDLTAYSGTTVQFGILASEGTVDDAADNEVFVDNFQVRNIPTCPEPSDLISNNLSLTSTEIGWTEAGTAAVWNIEYGVAGFAIGTGTVEAGVITNPFVLTGLTADTTYEFYVQAVCDATNLSSWTGPSEFFTGYCASEPTSNDGDGVTNVTIGITDFPSLGDVTYENQTLPVVNVFQGVDTNVAVTFATGFTYGTNIWIDFNDDLVFDNVTELVFQGESTNVNPTTLDASFIMPLTAPIGEHRMRIGTADNGQATPDPCYGGTWGVTLDFTVNIQLLTCILAEADYAINTDCSNDQFFIDVNVTSLGDATSLIISNDLNALTVQATNVGVYQAGPFPFGNTVKVFVTNEQDGNCVISSDFYEVLACPPANDDCDMAIVAFVNPDENCDTINPGTILAATPSGVPLGSCGGTPNDDVWFEFTAIGEQHIIDIQNIAGGTFNLDHGLYEGTCDNLTEIYCSQDTAALTPALIIDNTYYVRIFSAGQVSETTTFDLCISTFNPTFCLEALPICADPNIEYPSIVSENVAPPYLDYDCLFSQPDPQWNTIVFDDAGDYVFSLDQSNTAGTALDIDFIVWGPFVDQQSSCAQLLTENIADCSYSPTASETITLTGVPANSTYIILITNFSQQAGSYVFSQDSGPPDGTNCSVVCDVVLELEGAPIDDDIEDLATPDEIFDYCGFESVLLEATTFYSVDEYVWYKDGFVITDYDMPDLTVTESGTYQVQVLGGICDQSEVYFSALVEINFYDDTDTINPQNITLCDGPGSDGLEDFDLDALSTSLGLGADFNVSYYTGTDDANQAINAVPSPYNSAGETLIMRVEDADAAIDNYLGCRQLVNVMLVVNDRPVANQPTDFIVCDDTDGVVDGSTEFDLTSIDADVSTAADIDITYHMSQDDADNDTGALTSPYSSSGETIYVRVENTNTGCYETTSFNLEVNIVPLADFDPLIDYEVCPNATNPITISVIPTNFTETEVTVNWFLNGAPIIGADGLTLSTVLLSGDYDAEIIFNATGCVNTITVFVAELPTCIFPQGISPDATPGLNDTFDLSSFAVTKLEIFNRNGTLVYSKRNYTDEWVGQTKDGEELPVGTYFYTMTYEGGTKKRSAWVYINR